MADPSHPCRAAVQTPAGLLRCLEHMFLVEMTAFFLDFVLDIPEILWRIRPYDPSFQILVCDCIAAMDAVGYIAPSGQAYPK